ncbi:kinase-like domain-containing protein [Crassisporium funariophilum]|nr:kinase-like domain-containing protein [Crassisporium funariophilum]
MTTPRLYWELGAISTKPKWITVPDISIVNAISRQHLISGADSSAGELTVTFLTEGSFNKIYAVDLKTGSLVKSYIFRATLPVEPGDKVRNEVATMEYIKQHTQIPVPTVIAYDSSSENTLGYEWILMQRIPGKQLSDIWSDLSDTSKRAIVRATANHVLQMRKSCTFRDIGGLYHDPDTGFNIGPIITQFMFMGGRRQLVTRNRGPYCHDSDLVLALIDVQIAGIHLLRAMPSDDPNLDEDLIEDGPEILRLMEEMRSLVPAIFPRNEKNEPFRTVLLHPDLSLNNIMINADTLEITGIIDWECANASPQWQDTYPQFLTGPDVEKQPARVEPGDADELRNERWNDWEKVQLRAVFDEVAGSPLEEPLAILKREFVYHLEVVEYSQIMVERWISQTREKLKP